jgi:hypothetical protein
MKSKTINKSRLQSKNSNPNINIYMAQAFNEWMRRYIKNPEKFEVEFQTIKLFEADTKFKNQDEMYGYRCTAYLIQIMRELTAKRNAKKVRSTRRQKSTRKS